MTKAIYKIENMINNKVYIGQAVNPEQRFIEHCKHNSGYTSLINRAILKYGKENFTMTVLGWYEDYDQKEKDFIAEFQCVQPYGYNIAAGGSSQHRPAGESNPMEKITLELAKKIQRQCLDLSIQRKTIVKSNKITFDIFNHINDGTSWHDENLTYPLRPKEREINEARANKVIDLLKTTSLSYKDIGRAVGWNRSAVTMINNGKNHHRDNQNYPIR